VRVEVQQLPWTAAHEKLLTAFAGDVMPDICQLGNTWVPEFKAHRRAGSRCRTRRAASKLVMQSDYFPGIWDSNIDRRQAVGRAVVCRYARDVLPPRHAGRAGYARRRATGPTG
jgi:multiple sugar transport system substrate-binding protein